MTEKSWDVLYDKYPELFANRNKTPMESCMSFGIECSIGWYNIISSVCYQIKQHEKNIAERIVARNKYKKENDKSDLEYIPVKFDQIKEKFGGLRIYQSGGDDYVDGLISMAEEMSYKTCERCGCPGSPNKQGWIMTLCDSCRKNNER